MARLTEEITWIPVTERLPDDETTVLVAFDNADPWLGWHEDGKWYSVGSDLLENVTHWAEAPEGPA